MKLRALLRTGQLARAARTSLSEIPFTLTYRSAARARAKPFPANSPPSATPTARTTEPTVMLSKPNPRRSVVATPFSGERIHPDAACSRSKVRLNTPRVDCRGPAFGREGFHEIPLEEVAEDRVRLAQQSLQGIEEPRRFGDATLGQQ